MNKCLYEHWKTVGMLHNCYTCCKGAVGHVLLFDCNVIIRAYYKEDVRFTPLSIRFLNPLFDGLTDYVLID